MISSTLHRNSNASTHKEAAAQVAAVLERRISECGLAHTETVGSGFGGGGVAIYSATMNPQLQVPMKEDPLRELHYFHHSQVNALLLEGVSMTARDNLKSAGYQVSYCLEALSEDELCDGRLANVVVLGIRSKTKITENVLNAAPRLLAIGCFCIGTNQVDLNAAAKRGIAVFNSPYANSRSVAEMTLCNVISLARQLGDRNREMHEGVWNKVSARCYEIRGKTLGIIGYGHIGSQLSVLAEAMGMKVVFYDVLQLMPLGSAQQLTSLKEVLGAADFVTLHVPETPETKHMIGELELSYMKPEGYLINASRGSVVDVVALSQSLKSKRLAGAALDVFPIEPSCNGKSFSSPLLGVPNVILSPHIGGSTEEAQEGIGLEVSKALMLYLAEGCTQGSVTLPNLRLRPSSDPSTIRVSNVHRNVPGVLQKINKLLSNFNIERQSSEASGTIAYMMADVALDHGQLEIQLQAIQSGISGIEENVLSRVFY
jgi:D-3-phosphoglycerate dehydrogenase